MGYGISRDETRLNAFVADYNTIPYAFKVYDNTTGIADLHPFDKFTVAYVGHAKEAADAAFGAFKDGEWGKPEAIEAATKTLFTQLKALHQWALTLPDAEEPTIFAKYKKKQIVEDLDGVLTKIARVVDGLQYPMVAPDLYEGAADGCASQYEGGAVPSEGGKIPAELLAAYLEHPFFADLVKSQVIQAEVVPAFNMFGDGFSAADAMMMDPSAPPKVDAKFVASVLFFFVKAQENQSKDKEIWFAAYFTDADLAELNEATYYKDNKTLVFPGLIIAHDEYSGALGKAGASNDTLKHKIVFKYKNSKYFEHEGKFLIARLFAKVTEWDAEKKVCTIRETPNINWANVAAWVAAKTAQA